MRMSRASSATGSPGACRRPRRSDSAPGGVTTSPAATSASGSICGCSASTPTSRSRSPRTSRSRSVFDYFLSDVDLTKSIGVINPYTQRVAEVGQVHMYSDFNDGIGYNLAFLAKMGERVVGGRLVPLARQGRVRRRGVVRADSDRIRRLRWAGREPAAVQHQPEGPDRGQLPGRVPARARLARRHADDQRRRRPHGLGQLPELPITITGHPALSSVRAENYKDAYTYRLGFEYRTSKQWSWLFGALYDETPVPTEAFSRAAARRQPMGHLGGVLLRHHGEDPLRPRLPVPALRGPLDQRSRRRQLQGQYNTTANLLGVCLHYKF